MPAYQLPVYVWPAAVVGAGIIAAWRGGDNERMAAIGVLAGWALTIVIVPAHSGGTQWGAMGVDVVLLAFFLWLALRSPRFWPLFVAGFQLLLVITHFASAADSAVSGWAYKTAGMIWSFLIVFAIAYAGWTAPAFAEATEPQD